MKTLQIVALLLASRVLGSPSGFPEKSDHITAKPLRQAGPITPDSVATSDPFSQDNNNISPDPNTKTGHESSGAPTSDAPHLEKDIPYFYKAPRKSGSIAPNGIPASHQTVPKGNSKNTPPYGGRGSHEDAERKRYRSILYFTNWSIYNLGFHPQDIPADEITHLLYSFANIEPSGKVVSSDPTADIGRQYSSTDSTGRNAKGCVGEIFRLKKEHRNLKVLLSIGGWTYSPKFVSVAATEEGRRLFASSAVKLMADWGFDGLDIDWEYPGDKEEAHHFVLLLKACRKALDDYAKRHSLDYHFEITVAVPAGAQHYEKLDLEGMGPFIDAWHLMAYDYAMSGDRTSGHQAALFADEENPAATKFNTDDAVTGYLERGVPAHKIALGIPLYGRSFMNTAGPGEPFSGTVHDGSTEGGWLYKDLPQHGAEEHWDEDIVAAWSFEESTGEFVTYDSVESTEYKVEWLVEKGLAGAMFWEASGDKKGEDSLVGTVAWALPELDGTPNWLDYPDSVYDNIRNGNHRGGGHSDPWNTSTAASNYTSPSNSTSFERR